MTDDATPAKVRLTDGLGPLPPKTALGWDYGYTEDQMLAYAGSQVVRATATLKEALFQAQEAAKAMTAKAEALAAHRKPFAREAFEAWASDAYKWPNAIERSHDGYRLMQTQAAWEAWSMGWGAAEAAVTARQLADAAFAEWWDTAGSGMPPRQFEDAHEHVHRVAAACWAVACSERVRKVEERCSAWADIAGAHGAQVDRLKALLREVSAKRWECATEDGACPDCGAEDGDEHEIGCLLGQIDLETRA